MSADRLTAAVLDHIDAIVAEYDCDESQSDFDITDTRGSLAPETLGGYAKNAIPILVARVRELEERNAEGLRALETDRIAGKTWVETKLAQDEEARSLRASRDRVTADYHAERRVSAERLAEEELLRAALVSEQEGRRVAMETVQMMSATLVELRAKIAAMEAVILAAGEVVAAAGGESNLLLVDSLLTLAEALAALHPAVIARSAGGE